ncbi:hypothetical protein [Microbacterium hydrocarbonoxydans]|uniref:hypothetical protein n=1 Tax=Microbacterium hydrocarbonoxydans TaxID=273678 RepID=UPI0013DAB354|nr:hypothetical protein [Microbacterium hydrocarbonoxydans]
MIPALVLKVVLFAAALLFVVLVARRARRRPNRSKSHPDRVRMPRIVGIVGWATFAAGALMSYAAFTSRADDVLGMQIGGVALVAGGLLFALMYHNWYVSSGPDELSYRTVLGAERTIRYADIADYRFRDHRGRRMLQVRSVTGERFAVDIAVHPVPDLLAHIAFHQAHGRWPVRGELRAAGR